MSRRFLACRVSPGEPLQPVMMGCASTTICRCSALISHSPEHDILIVVSAAFLSSCCLACHFTFTTSPLWTSPSYLHRAAPYGYPRLPSSNSGLHPTPCIHMIGALQMIFGLDLKLPPRRRVRRINDSEFPQTRCFLV